MAITVVHIRTPPYYRVLKGGKRVSKPYRWTVEVRYLAGDIKRRLLLKPDGELWLHELSPLIDNAIRADREIHGDIFNLMWTAMTR